MRPSFALRPQTTPGRGGEERSALLELFSRAGFPFWLVLVLAALLALLAPLVSSKGRVSNMDLVGSGFPDAYLMISKTARDRCYLTSRRDSTIRRSRKKLPGRMWHLNHIEADLAAGIPDQWLLRSKAQGTVFLVPVEEVENWLVPFLYRFVRSEDENLDLPPAGWVQLYVNRVYQGLYLQMDFPLDPRRKDGRTGPLRELLTVQGDEMTLVNTRLEPASVIYSDCVAAGLFPRVAEPSAELAWLARRRPCAEAVFLLGSDDPSRVSLLPLPLSINTLFDRFQGTPLAPTRDERFHWWVGDSWADEETAEPPFTSEQMGRFEAELVKYVEGFEISLAAHRRLHPASPVDPSDGRWVSAAALGFDLEGVER